MNERFEWDDQKNADNLRKHGIRFEEAIEMFSGLVLTTIDDRQDYGEIREVSVGLIEHVVVLSVAHTDRDGVRRIISARRASRSERRLFYEYLEKALG